MAWEDQNPLACELFLIVQLLYLRSSAFIFIRGFSYRIDDTPAASADNGASTFKFFAACPETAEHQVLRDAIT